MEYERGHEMGTNQKYNRPICGFVREYPRTHLENIPEIKQNIMADIHSHFLYLRLYILSIILKCHESIPEPY